MGCLQLAAQATTLPGLTVHTDPPRGGTGYFAGTGNAAVFTLMPYATYRTHHAAHPPYQQLALQVAGVAWTRVLALPCYQDQPDTRNINEAPRHVGRDTIWTYRPRTAWNITRWRGRLPIVACLPGGRIPIAPTTFFTIDKRKQICLIARSWLSTSTDARMNAQLRWCCNFVARVYAQVGLPLQSVDDVTSQFHEASIPDNGDGSLIFYTLKLRGVPEANRTPDYFAHVAIKDGSQRININGYPLNGRYKASRASLYEGAGSYYARRVVFRSTVDLDDRTVRLLPGPTRPVASPPVVAAKPPQKHVTVSALQKPSQSSRTPAVRRWPFSGIFQGQRNARRA